MIKKSNNYKIKKDCSTETKGKHSKVLNDFLYDKNLKPVMCYEHLQLQETKEKINKYCKEKREKSGIYLILNKITLNFYIGSAFRNKIYSRYYKHLISFDS